MSKITNCQMILFSLLKIIKHNHIKFFNVCNCYWIVSGCFSLRYCDLTFTIHEYCNKHVLFRIRTVDLSTCNLWEKVSSKKKFLELLPIVARTGNMK